MNSCVSVDINEGVATITWDNAEEAVNLFSAVAIAEFREIVHQIARDDNISGVVIRSAKTAFHAGADLNLVQGLFRQSAEEVTALLKEVRDTLYTLETCNKPVAAAINGHALGGGFEMALACHARFVEDVPTAKLGLPEAAVGLMPGFGGTQRMARLMDYREAADAILKGKRFTPQAALDAGLVTDIVPVGQAEEVARCWVLNQTSALQPWMQKGYRVVQDRGRFETYFSGLNAQIGKRGWGNQRHQELIAETLYHGLQLAIEPALDHEIRCFVELVRHPTTEGMLRTNFFGIAGARSLDRRPTVAKTKLEKVGVLGSGLMGSGIAYSAIGAGIDVVVLDVSDEVAQQAREYSERLLAKVRARGRITEAQSNVLLGRLVTGSDYALLADCDLVVEAVFEDFSLKKAVLEQAENAIGPDAILASNTSTIPISQLANTLQRPERFLGLHFFSPVEQMNLLEIIRGQATSDETLATGFDLAEAFGKVPIAVNDGRAFYTTRCVVGYMQEGMALVGEGVPPSMIDAAGRAAGMPMGPLMLCDLVNLDLIEKIESQTEADLGTDYVPHPSRDLGQKMIEKGRLGQKVGAGFYDYSDEKPRLWHGLSDVTGAATVSADINTLEDRLIIRQALEALRCFDDGVIDNARDADIGSVLGWGFAPHTGGVASYIDQIGAARLLAYCETAEAELGPRFKPAEKLKTLAATNQKMFAD